MPTTRTYHIGFENQVRRLDNLSGAWTNIPIVISSLSVNDPFYDVETDPTNGDKVVVVGQTNIQNGRGGIYISTDAGLTWTQPGGNFINNAYVFGPGPVPAWSEVDFHDTNNIFVVGSNGYMAVSTDGGLTFNLSTQIPAVPTCAICPSVINNVTSVDFISPTTGVVGLSATIAKTTDAGVTWNVLPLINIPIVNDPKTILGIHISANEQVIVALGQAAIARSTDGGTTWTAAYTFTGRVGRHLTWINDNELWAFCEEDLILKSVDAGATWTVVRPQDPSGPRHLAGHFYQGQNGFFNSNKLLNATSDGATTDVLSDTGNFPITAVWTWLAPVNCFKLTPCDNAYPTFYVSNNFVNYVDQYITICPSNLPSNVVNTPSGLVFSIPPFEASVEYNLRDCCDPNNIITLSQYNLISFQISGNIIQIDQLPGKCWTVEKQTVQTEPIILTGNLTGYEYANCPSCTGDFACQSVPIPVLPDCMCYLVEQTTDCIDVITLTGVDTLESFVSCEACLAGQNPPCYLLTDCEDPEHTIVTNDDLSQYVDQVIQIKSCPGYCFTVSITQDCTGFVSGLVITGNFTTCELCNPKPVVPVNLITRRVKPGYDTPACPPAYTEKVNCTYGEAMYLEVISKRYGIEDCCDIDATKWTIKKELLDIKVLEDPNFITPPPVVCTCYSIEQILETVTYKYINCDGCLTSITITPGNIEYLCSQTYPKPYCPPSGYESIIIGGVDICTTDQDCIPPPVECRCYYIEGSVPMTFNYITCDGQDVTQIFETSVVNICAQKDTVTLVEGTIKIFVEGGVCTNDLDCYPCECYVIKSLIETPQEIQAIDCDNNNILISLPPLQGIYVCLKQVQNVVSRAVQVVKLNVDNCPTECQENCACLEVRALFDIANITYLNCDNYVQSLVVQQGETANVCGKFGSITVLSQQAPEITVLGDCPCPIPPPPCNCYQVRGSEMSGGSYTNCSNQLQELVFNNPGIQYICAQPDSFSGLYGDIDIILQDINCITDSELCTTTCNCYEFIIPPIGVSVGVTYYRCADGQQVTDFFADNGIYRVCAVLTPTTEVAGITFTPVSDCTNTQACQIPCGCYKVTNNFLDNRVITVTDCNGVTSDKILLPGISYYFCATAIINPFPDVTIEIQSSCNGQSICETIQCSQGCCCYEISIFSDALGANFTYTDCNGQPQNEYQLNGTYYRCASDYPVLGSFDGTVTNLGNCAGNTLCQQL